VSLGLEFSRLIDATPEEVFDALSERGGQDAFYREDASG
jgi:uncharacterized protein YndB with AHSA1/START domain